MSPYRRVFRTLVFVGVLSGTFPALADNKPAEKPDHWIAAMYFHRTQRCPTCKKISAYIEEATNAGFTQEIKHGAVGVYLIDKEDFFKYVQNGIAGYLEEK